MQAYGVVDYKFLSLRSTHLEFLIFLGRRGYVATTLKTGVAFNIVDGHEASLDLPEVWTILRRKKRSE